MVGQEGVMLLKQTVRFTPNSVWLRRGAPAGISADEINAGAYDFLKFESGRFIPAAKALSFLMRSVTGFQRDRATPGGMSAIKIDACAYNFFMQL